MTTTMNNRMEQINLLLSPDGISVQWTEKFKNNGRKKGLLVHGREKNCSPILYVDEDFWEKSDTDIVEFLKDAYETHSCQIDTDEFLSRESILQKVLPRVFSASNISLMQKDHLVFEQQMNLVFAFYVPLCGDEKGMATVTLTELILREYDIDREELLVAAAKNMEKETVIEDMFLLLQKMGYIPQEEEGTAPSSLLVATNKAQLHGAGILFCKEALLKIGEKLGEKYVILPSSIHECICVPFVSEEEISHFRQMVREVNQSAVLPEDRLTDSVYLCDRGILSLAAE